MVVLIDKSASARFNIKVSRNDFPFTGKDVGWREHVTAPVPRGDGMQGFPKTVGFLLQAANFIGFLQKYFKKDKKSDLKKPFSYDFTKSKLNPSN